MSITERFEVTTQLFVTATAAINEFWLDDNLTQKINRDAKKIRDVLLDIADSTDAEVRGRGMIQGVQFDDCQIASEISKVAFENGLIIETGRSTR